MSVASAAFGLIGDEETLWTVGGDVFCLFPDLPTNECSHFARLGGIDGGVCITPETSTLAIVVEVALTCTTTE
ncbi:hypothetical protein PF003_g10744 [Phytophthora fragariae]|nr:hypothetical protein PF003_g10744 [Phytophthora fragariae]